MVKKIFAASVIGLLFLVLFIFFSTTGHAEVRIEAKKVDYTLPYPGLLPDHPLYMIKEIRDNVLIFFTRDYLKKTEIQLLLSDKKIVMADDLAKKGKWQVSSAIALEAEQQSVGIPELVSRSKRQGASASDNFIQKLKMSNAKHQEIIEDLLKNSPQGERTKFEKALSLNKEITKKIAAP